MKFVAKKFEELTTTELYEILKSRTEIFIIEQNCFYQDLDNIDYNSLHIFYQQDNRVIAYLRAFVDESNKNVIHIGRVLTIKRKKGLGRKLMEESIKTTKDRMNGKILFMEAQKHAIGFYEKFGFKIISDEFAIDGIPHIKMELEL